MAPKTVIAFDAYGTLLSTASIASKLAAHFGQEKASSVAALWRRYQLEYTWRLTSMGKYEPFSTLTRRSLLHAVAEHSLSLSDSDVDDLMTAYDSLSIFPDVSGCLTSLQNKSDISAVVFSNGTKEMVANSVHKSPDLSPYASTFQDIVVVEKVKKFKPAPEVYWHLAEQVGLGKNQMGKLWLVSGNPFDIVGARTVGMQAIWVDRDGKGWIDQLAADDKARPTAVVKSLEEVVGIVEKTVPSS
ncbi:haloacid dehalogenase, type II [Elsinoe ampelina]|uniref:Haloacid dehalogenase, type II n=1 Tax=Elsinoe ampelina TaxID=302913 RepID=A0A6A6G305_9PEZI|nr:haloacid dehalogenase, type II [Elsinoe ampelina]